MPSDEQKGGSRAIDIGGHIGELYLSNHAAGAYELRIDAEGRWFHGGVEIVRRDIARLFSSNLRRARAGSYYLRIGKDEAPVVVEDAPFVVLRVEETPGGRLRLLLTDGSFEPLRPKTLALRASGIPYCLVRGNMEAKFSRQAYYQLAKHIECDERGGLCYLSVGGARVRLNIRVEQ